EEMWVEVLAHVWNAVKWRKIRGRKHIDVFEHRVEYAKYESDPASFLQRLANALSIQGVVVPVETLERLRGCSDLAMDVVRRWTKVIVLKASVKSRELRGKSTAVVEGDEQSPDEPSGEGEEKRGEVNGS
ncbi:hypothetical protein, partial [Infirmifilum sp.]|uniref:hypothetical protein n=1 Tax=Infirmifilum sp. TaxID=2856575 RepID=UPI003D0CE2A9